MYFIDPTLTQDIYADKPWALVRSAASLLESPASKPRETNTSPPPPQSPLLSTVNYLSVQKMNPEEPLPAFDYVVEEDFTPVANDPTLKDHPDKRKKWLSDPKNHSSVTLGPDTFVRLLLSPPPSLRALNLIAFESSPQTSATAVRTRRLFPEHCRLMTVFLLPQLSTLKRSA